MSIAAEENHDATAPLPSGRMALEASAGTGKTHALAGLATRFLAETDLATSELLVVTFTRAATGELRARVREMMVAVADALDGGPAAPAVDELVEHLSAARPALHLERLRRAIAEFDAATITTIHGFARQARVLLGVAAGVDPDARLVDDTDLLVDAACSDALASAAADGRGGPEFPTLPRLVQATRHALRLPGVQLVPGRDDRGVAERDLLLVDLVERSIAEVEARRALRGTVGFDDVLSDLAGALRGRGSDAVVEALRARYRVALIDEFQDTDPVQWQIFSDLFGEGSGTTLVTVGDPKQAIFGFRGADVHTYLAAVGPGSGAERRSLTVNWRSDGGVLDSFSALLDGVVFGEADIPFVPVRPAADNRDRRMQLRGGPASPLVIKPVVDPAIRANKNGSRSTPAAALAVVRDLVATVVDLLDEARIPGPDGVERALRPSDVAVLVSTGTQGEDVLAELRAARIPAVLTAGKLNVLDTPAAEQLRLLLDAMARPSDTRRARAFAMSWFVGWRAEEVAASAEPGAALGEELAHWQDRLRRWSDLLGERCVADVFGAIWSETGVEAKVLAGSDGDRNVTDLDHLVELLHGRAPNGMAAVAGLRAGLDERAEGMTDTDTETATELLQRRIESEDLAVQVMTIWMAKGLEFPVVCLPMLWRGGLGPKGSACVFVDPDTGRRTLDLTGGGPWPDKADGIERKRLAQAERAGQNLRALYVALTRAQHQVVLWWANAHESDKTALARVLLARRDGVIDDELLRSETFRVPRDDEVLERLGQLGVRSGGSIAVEPLRSPVERRRWTPQPSSEPPSDLAVATLDAEPDRSTRRWSFSAITSHVAAGSDPFDPTMSDAGAGDEHADDTGQRPAVAAEPMGHLASLPAGTGFGTLVHRVLDGLDFAAPDLRGAVAAAIERELAARPFDLDGPASGGPESGAERERPDVDGRTRLVEGLSDALVTPLGPQFGEIRLADLRQGDRLAEMVFDLRLGEAGRRPRLFEIGELVSSHLAVDDPLREWAHEAAVGHDVELAGQLTGSIDLVMRIPHPSGEPRFVVADYKTNLLTPPGREPSADDYGHAALVASMADHDYPLQALLYSVALHRYLRWTLDGYDPEAHLGGAAYLFVRGMTGPTVTTSEGRPHGVFGWPLPSRLVVELSDLLDGHTGSR